MLRVKRPALRQDERLVWEGRAGQRLATVDVVPWLAASCLLLLALAVLRESTVAIDPWIGVAIASAIFLFLAMWALAWLQPRLGPSFFLTTSRLIVWSTLRQRLLAFRLADIASAQRYVAVHSTGRGLSARTVRRTTSQVEISLRDGDRFSFGPLPDPDAFIALLVDALLRGGSGGPPG